MPQGLEFLYDALGAVPNQLTPSYRRGGNPLESVARESAEQPGPAQVDPKTTETLEELLRQQFSGPYDEEAMQGVIELLRGLLAGNPRMAPADMQQFIMDRLGQQPIVEHPGLASMGGGKDVGRVGSPEAGIIDMILGAQ